MTSELQQPYSNMTLRMTPLRPPGSSDRNEGGGVDSSALAAPKLHDVLDGPSLDKLRELDPSGKNGLLERVFKAFESSVSRLMGQLASARTTNDMHMIRHVTHTLKSSSASIGALRLSRLCSEIENMVRQSITDGLQERLAEMDAELEVVMTAVRAMQGGAR
jgi:HPt (histidine-containing phosphotransfer) domain-containing protein